MENNVSATLTEINKPITENLANMTPAFTTILKMGNTICPSVR